MELQEKYPISSDNEYADSEALSDTGEDIPDPNDSSESLYQDKNKLPQGLQKHHFEEGLVYAMTLESNHKVMMLGMIIELKDSVFVWRTFFIEEQKKTYYEGAKDVEYRYLDIWRLAPRRELVKCQNPSTARFGQTLRFEYGVGMETSVIRAIITRTSSRKLRGVIECGRNRGDVDFDVLEITG